MAKGEFLGIDRTCEQPKWFGEPLGRFPCLHGYGLDRSIGVSGSGLRTRVDRIIA